MKDKINEKIESIEAKAKLNVECASELLVELLEICKRFSCNQCSRAAKALNELYK